MESSPSSESTGKDSDKILHVRTVTFFKKRDVLQLRYRVLVHGGNAEEAKIGELFEKYKKQFKSCALGLK